MNPERSVLVLLGDPRLPDPVKRDCRFNPEDQETVARFKAALGTLAGWDFSYIDEHGRLIDRLLAWKGELALNFCDEGFGNDPAKELHIPALLELLDLPYTGAGPACLALCHDKSHVKAIAASLGVPVPRAARLDWTEVSAMADAIASAANAIGYPVMLKPERGDGSIGIARESLIVSPEGIFPALAALRERRLEPALLVEEYLGGPEYIAGLVGNPAAGFTALPLLEVDYSRLPRGAPPILCYESKWEPESDYWRLLRFPPSRLGAAEQDELFGSCELLFERLGCRDYARLDFRAGADGRPRLLEVNPNPGWCWDGKLALMAEEGGWSYAELLERIIEVALRRLRAEGVYART